MRFAAPKSSRPKDSFSPLGAPKARVSKPCPRASVAGSEPATAMSPLQSGYRASYPAGKSSGNHGAGSGIERQGPWEYSGRSRIRLHAVGFFGFPFPLLSCFGRCRLSDTPWLQVLFSSARVVPLSLERDVGRQVVLGELGLLLPVLEASVVSSSGTRTVL